MVCPYSPLVKVKVQVPSLCIDIVPGEPVIYKMGDIFECPKERAKKLGNSVIILLEPKNKKKAECNIYQKDGETCNSIQGFDYCGKFRELEIKRHWRK